MIGRVFTHIGKGKIIIDNLRKTKNILYGARAMNAQLPFMFYRHTKDYDIYSKKPRISALRLEKLLDESAGNDVYYTKQALHKGTYKVIDKGHDNIKGTRDDFGIVDFTKPLRKIRTITINDVRYAFLSERVKDARRSLREPEFAYRHEKDRRDLWRIKQGRRLGGLFGW